MKSEAIFLTKYGRSSKAFERRTIEMAALNENDVLIEVEAFGLNYADVMARNKLYRAAPPLPCILGYEVVGKIIELGSNVSTNYLGKRVVAFTRFGGYAKHIKSSLENLAEIDTLESSQALALATQYVTAFYMCEYLSPIHKNEKVLIHAAAGGVGSALILFSKKKGAYVYAKVSSDQKGEYVKSLGADTVINYKKFDYESQILELLGNKKLDHIFNPVAGSTFKKDLRLLGSGGKIFLFGGSELLGTKFGFFSSLNFLRKMGIMLPIALMMKSKSILGVNMLNIADEKPEILSFCLKEVVRQCLNQEIKVSLGTIFPIQEIAQAHDLLESGASIGKIAVKW